MAVNQLFLLFLNSTLQLLKLNVLQQINLDSLVSSSDFLGEFFFQLILDGFLQL